MVTFNEEFINSVKEANDIVDIAGDYFDVKKFGDVYKAKCKHPGGDKTPSLTFFPSTQSFYCFGCHAGKKDGNTNGSDVISFLQWADDMSWQDAVIHLAEKANIEVPKKELSSEDRQKMLLYEAALIENRIVWANLDTEEGAEVRKWFNARGISDVDINKWRLGAAKEGKSKELFPCYSIMDDRGRTVGFSNRLGSNGSKYKNSPSSPIFKKGSILFGLNFIIKDIRQKKHMVIVEGYNDAIVLQKYGIPAVALLSTSITDKQMDLIKKYTDSVVLFLDGDEAGIKNTIVNAKALRKQGIQVEVVNVKGADPDDIALTYKEKTTDFINTNKRLIFTFMSNNILDEYFDKLLRLKNETIKEFETVLEYIDDHSEKSIYKEELLRIVSSERKNKD